MIKCPFCHYENEDGALFCEQCKSDLSGVDVPAAAPPAYAEAIFAEPVQAEPVEAELVEAVPVEAVPIEAEPIQAEAVQAEPVETYPLAGDVPAEAAARAETPPPAPAEAPAVEAIPAEPAPDTQPVAEIQPPEPELAVPATAAPAEGAPAPQPTAPAETGPREIPQGAEPRLFVLRGVKRGVEYPIYEGLNFIGRSDEKPVDIDLEDQEPPERVWCSRQHALITFEERKLFLEDLNSANGTYLNRNRVYPGQKQPLGVNDVIQIGSVQLKLIV